MEFQEIKAKRAWKKFLPEAQSFRAPIVCSELEPMMNEKRPVYTVMSQADFLREFYPSGHLINDPVYYPDIEREETVEEIDERGVGTGRFKTTRYVEFVPRYSFAFQQIITVKQLVHLFGNDTQFDLLNDSPSDAERRIFNEFKTGWLIKDCDVALYELGKSVFTTGDGAIVGYLSNGKFGLATMSYKNGDTLYPHYDSISGELVLFARSYSSTDSEDNEIAEYLEVWDDKKFRRYRKSKKSNAVTKVLRAFGLSGFELIDEREHGFPFIPVVYFRDDDGPCWEPAQDSIDGFELSYSQMAHNNRAFGEPILYTKDGGGNGVQPTHDINGTIRIMDMGKDDEAGYLQAQSASESYQKQLDMNYKLIYEQTFTVIPPELKSGDLPAAALKIMYSPAYERAETKAKEFQPAVNVLAKIFAYGYGVETEKEIYFSNLDIKPWIKPYVHVNESAVVNDLSAAVQNGFCSKQTASERVSFYTTNDEWDRIMREAKEQQKEQLLMQQKQAEINAKNNAESQNKSTSESKNKEVSK